MTTDRADHVTLLNPISPERSLMRRTLLPGLLAVAQKNLEAADSVALYELGPVYIPKAGEKLPDEPRRLAVVLCGRRTGAAWDDPQGVVAGALRLLRPEGRRRIARVRPALARRVRSRPRKRCRGCTRCARPGCGVNGLAVGVFGELHPKVAANFLLSDRAVQVAELDLEAILAAVPERYGYKPFSTFPPAKRDVAIVVPEATTAEAVLAEIRAAGGELLTDATLFDVYRGTGLPDGTKSLAFALTYQAPDRTLGEKEIAKAHEKVEGRLRQVLEGADSR